ncbi:MAG: VTC domain-containing protein [Candidatus Omnitrophica bacterium]|nr:VTC domain-containing protein [Candidatus Omnitrophota bacterium]
MKNILLSGVKNFRYERKIFIEGQTIKTVEMLLKSHPAIFSEIYCERRVNSLYFDTLNFQNYFDNMDGVSKRLKVRVRWYGNLFGAVEKPNLELKFKHNLHVGKLMYPIEAFVLKDGFSTSIVREAFRRSSLSKMLEDYLMGLQASLMISYTRRYFLSFDRKYRVTLDTEMEAYKLTPQRNTFLCKTEKDTRNVIMEIKYNCLHDDLVGSITNYFPFRTTKSSKYVSGIEVLYA